METGADPGPLPVDLDALDPKEMAHQAPAGGEMGAGQKRKRTPEEDLEAAKRQNARLEAFEK